MKKVSEEKIWAVGDMVRVRILDQRITVLLLDVSDLAETVDVKNGLTQAGVSGSGGDKSNVTVKKNHGG